MYYTYLEFIKPLAVSPLTALKPLTSVYVGSGEKKTAYFYKRTRGPGGGAHAPSSEPRLVIKRIDNDNGGTVEEEITCDECFYNVIETATADIETQLDAVERATTCALSSARTRMDTNIQATNSFLTESNLTISESVKSGTSEKVVLLLNTTRASPLGNLRAKKLEEQFGVRVITVKLCRSLKEVDRDTRKLVHICAEFKSADGIRKIKQMLATHNMPPPWAMIVDYMEPFAYGSG